MNIRHFGHLFIIGTMVSLQAAAQMDEYKSFPVFVHADETVTQTPFFLWISTTDFGGKVLSPVDRKVSNEESFAASIWSILQSHDSHDLKELSTNYDSNTAHALFAMIGEKISPEDALLCRFDLGDLSVFMIELQKVNVVVPICIRLGNGSPKFDMAAAMEPIVQVLSTNFIYEKIASAGKKEEKEPACEYYIKLPFNGAFPSEKAFFLCFGGEVVHKEKSSGDSTVDTILEKIEKVHGQSPSMKEGDLAGVFGKKSLELYRHNYSDKTTEDFFTRFFNNNTPEFLSWNGAMCYLFSRFPRNSSQSETEYRMLTYLEDEWKIVGLDQSGPFDLVIGDPLVSSQIQYIIENDLKELPME